MKPSHHYRPVKAPPRSRQKDYLLRLVVAFVMILVFFSVLVWQFVRLQVARHEEFVDKAAANRISLIPTPPIRGEITDVNGVVLAHNYPALPCRIPILRAHSVEIETEHRRSGTAGGGVVPV